MLKRFHLYGITRSLFFYLINHVFSGTRFFALKRSLLIFLGYDIGVRTRIVGPIYITTALRIGSDVWIGRNFECIGNGLVQIGDNCDLGPDVTIITGSHQIGDHFHRASTGFNSNICIENGCWVGARSTIINNTTIHEGAVIAACACVCKDVETDTLYGGVPAKKIKDLFT